MFKIHIQKNCIFIFEFSKIHFQFLKQNVLSFIPRRIFADSLRKFYSSKCFENFHQFQFKQKSIFWSLRFQNLYFHRFIFFQKNAEIYLILVKTWRFHLPAALAWTVSKFIFIRFFLQIWIFKDSFIKFPWLVFSSMHFLYFKTPIPIIYLVRKPVTYSNHLMAFRYHHLATLLNHNVVKADWPSVVIGHESSRL